jgi:hypothetical protein
MEKYRLLVYKKVGRHKLIRKFRSYHKIAEYFFKNIKEEDLCNYYVKKQKI